MTILGTERNHNLWSLRTLIDAIRGVDAEMPAQTLKALIEIGMQPGITQVELGQKLQIASSSANRIVKRLGAWKSHGEDGQKVAGMKLVKSIRRAHDARYVETTLTPAGEAFVARMATAVNKKGGKL